MEVHRPLWTPTVTFASDASGSWGCGAVWQQAWLQRQWDREWADENIAAKELVPIAVACMCHFGPGMAPATGVGTVRQYGGGTGNLGPVE